MNEQIMANEEVMEVAETVAEEVVEVSTKPKFNLGKALLGGAVAVGTVFGIVKLVQWGKAKAEAKKAEKEKVEPTTEEAKVDWDEVEKIAKEPIDDLDA
jgi:hypothetical protein